MKLPAADRAVVEQAKVVDYLLNPWHSGNGGKADFFVGVGFNRTGWQVFALALRRLAEIGAVSVHMETTYGDKYVVDGRLETPSGRLPVVRTIWIVDRGAEVPRLITAYPYGE